MGITFRGWGGMDGPGRSTADYRWQVSYSGDANNANSAAACSDPVTLTDVTAPETKINVKLKYQANRDTRIRFKSNDPDAAFECKLDKGKWNTCASPISYKKLKPDKHTFYVRATTPTVIPTDAGQGLVQGQEAEALIRATW